MKGGYSFDCSGYHCTKVVNAITHFQKFNPNILTNIGLKTIREKENIFIH